MPYTNTAASLRQCSAFLFDLYGTLVDIHTDENRPSLWKQTADFMLSRGAARDAEALQRAYLTNVRAEEALLRQRDKALPNAQGEIDLTSVFARLYAEKGVQADHELIAETAWFFRRASTSHLRLYAGARELLDALRAAGKTVILLSNAQAAFTLPELDELGLAQRFDRIFISSDAGFKKPDPRFFRMPLETLGLEPADCLMIGNDPDCDVKGALAVGMDAAFLRSALSPAGDLPKDAVLCLPRMDLRRLKRCLLHMEE